MFNIPAPPGFQGLHPSKPIHFYQRHLPHWRQDGATYFVTFRLADSLPQEKLIKLERLREQWHQRNPPPHSDTQREELGRLFAEHVERWLDEGMGSCVLRDAPHAVVLAQTMHHFDGDRYELDAYVVMPNHVHAILRPLVPQEQPLEKIVGSWKRHASRQINVELNRTGSALWEDETFDRIIRDEEHLYRVIQYIGRNPDRAGLSREACRLWIRPAWAELGWIFEPPR